SFTPRLVANAAVNFLQETTTAPGVENFNQSIFDTFLGLDYVLTRDMSLNFSYSLTSVTSNRPNTDYYRNRVFFGASYQF
ncbi:MAG: outer membrane beta-barrel protein, partial [Chthoniobacteraceae bacterium]